MSDKFKEAIESESGVLIKINSKDDNLSIMSNIDLNKEEMGGVMAVLVMAMGEHTKSECECENCKRLH